MQSAPSIFIGYRRQDSQGFAGRVADDLIDNFGVAQVFRDDDIPEGTDFTSVLERALGRCGVLIVVIGPNWLRIKDDDKLPRLFHPDDWVRREIEKQDNDKRHHFKTLWLDWYERYPTADLPDVHAWVIFPTVSGRCFYEHCGQVQHCSWVGMYSTITQLPSNEKWYLTSWRSRKVKSAF